MGVPPRYHLFMGFSHGNKQSSGLEEAPWLWKPPYEWTLILLEFPVMSL